MPGQPGRSGGQNRNDPKPANLDNIAPTKPKLLLPEAHNEFDEVCEFLKAKGALSSTDSYVIADIANWMHLYQLCLEDITINGMILNSGETTIKRNPALDFFRDASNTMYSRLYRLEDRAPVQVKTSGKDKLEAFAAQRHKGPKPAPQTPEEK